VKKNACLSQKTSRIQLFLRKGVPSDRSQVPDAYNLLRPNLGHLRRGWCDSRWRLGGSRGQNGLYNGHEHDRRTRMIHQDCANFSEWIQPWKMRNTPDIMIPRNVIHRDGRVELEDALEPSKIRLVSISTRLGRHMKRENMHDLHGKYTTHSSSEIASRPLSIMSPRNTTTSGRVRRAARQFLRKFRSTNSRVR
jgi:hypothetical protein